MTISADDMVLVDGDPASEPIEQLITQLFPDEKDLPRIPKQARSRQKYAWLMQAATVLFVERGYAATTADDIAARANVSVGTFYNYFKNKRQIFLMLVLGQLENIFSNLQLTEMDFSRSGNHRETIRKAITAVMGNNEQNGLRRVWGELLSLHPDLIPDQRRIREYTLKRLEDRLLIAVANEFTWPDLDVEATAYSIFTLLDALSVRHDEPVPDTRLIESLTDMLYRSLFRESVQQPNG